MFFLTLKKKLTCFTYSSTSELGYSIDFPHNFDWQICCKFAANFRKILIRAQKCF